MTAAAARAASRSGRRAGGLGSGRLDGQHALGHFAGTLQLAGHEQECCTRCSGGW